MLEVPAGVSFLLCFIATWTCVVVSVNVGCLQFECVPVYVSVCFVC